MYNVRLHLSADEVYLMKRAALDRGMTVTAWITGLVRAKLADTSASGEGQKKPSSNKKRSS